VKKLVNAPAGEIRFLVAVNPGTDPDILERLTVDHEPAVRQGVAMNRNTPHALLLQSS
jgi:hypothetical protein